MRKRSDQPGRGDDRPQLRAMWRQARRQELHDLYHGPRMTLHAMICAAGFVMGRWPPVIRSEGALYG